MVDGGLESVGMATALSVVSAEVPVVAETGSLVTGAGSFPHPTRPSREPILSAQPKGIRRRRPVANGRDEGEPLVVGSTENLLPMAYSFTQFSLQAEEG
jgi:hypothetical protein